jgi:hypothetical protein
LFTDKGQVIFLKVRDRVKELLRTAGAFRMHAAIGGIEGSSWQLIACIDRLVELGEIVQCPNPVSEATQFRVYTDHTRL